jgi:hypothetical protein
LLRFSQPQWLETLRSGVNLIVFGVLIYIFGVFFAVSAAATSHNALPVTILTVLYAGMTLLGSWRLTAPDPSGLGEDQYGTSRKVIRIGLGFSLANQMIALLRTQLMYLAVDPQLITYATLLIELVGIVAIFAELDYLKKIALRFPDQKLSARAAFLMYALSLSQLGLVALRVWRNFAPFSRAAASGIPALVVGVACLVFGIMYLSMLSTFGRLFKVSAESARSLWQGPAAHPGPGGALAELNGQ